MPSPYIDGQLEPDVTTVVSGLSRRPYIEQPSVVTLRETHATGKFPGFAETLISVDDPTAAQPALNLLMWASIGMTCLLQLKATSQPAARNASSIVNSGSCQWPFGRLVNDGIGRRPLKQRSKQARSPKRNHSLPKASLHSSLARAAERSASWPVLVSHCQIGVRSRATIIVSAKRQRALSLVLDKVDYDQSSSLLDGQKHLCSIGPITGPPYLDRAGYRQSGPRSSLSSFLC